MSMQILQYLIPYIFAFLVSTGVGVYSWHRRNVKSAAEYSLGAFAQSLWTLGFIFELLSSKIETKIFWDNFQWIGVFGWALAFLAFSIKYSDRKLTNPVRTWCLLFIAPVLFMIFIFTNNTHGLIRSFEHLIPGDPFSELRYDFETLIWIISIYTYFLVIGGLIHLIRKFFHPHRLYRTQTGIIMTGSLIPLIGSVMILFKTIPSFHRDIIPLSGALGNLIIVWGLFRYKVFNIVPIARDAVIENISDMVVVLDVQNRIIDINHAALKTLGITASKIIGNPVSQVFLVDPEENLRD